MCVPSSEALKHFLSLVTTYSLESSLSLRSSPSSQLPCGHEYCFTCLAELRSKDVPQTCPLCRADMPPGPNVLSEVRLWA